MRRCVQTFDWYCMYMNTHSALYISQILLTIIASLPTAAANDNHNCWALHLWNLLSLPRFFYTKNRSKTPAINKPPKNHLALTFFYIFVCSSALLFFIHIYPLSSLHPQALLSGPRNLAHSEKHSWKAFSPPDQGDFLIIHSLLSLSLSLCLFFFSCVNTQLLCCCFACY